MVARVSSHLVCTFLFTYLQSLFIPENLWTSECQIWRVGRRWRRSPAWWQKNKRHRQRGMANRKRKAAPGWAWGKMCWCPSLGHSHPRPGVSLNPPGVSHPTSILAPGPPPPWGNHKTALPSSPAISLGRCGIRIALPTTLVGRITLHHGSLGNGT